MDNGEIGRGLMVEIPIESHLRGIGGLGKLRGLREAGEQDHEKMIITLAKLQHF